MTELDRLRAAVITANGPASLNSAAFWDSRGEILRAMPALLELWDTCERETAVVCVPGCVGDNHVEACDGDGLRSDRLAILNKLRGMQ